MRPASWSRSNARGTSDAAHDDLGDALLGEHLLEVSGRERVVRGLGELRLTGLRLERADVGDVAAARSNVVPDPG